MGDSEASSFSMERQDIWESRSFLSALLRRQLSQMRVTEAARMGTPMSIPTHNAVYFVEADTVNAKNLRFVSGSRRWRMTRFLSLQLAHFGLECSPSAKH